MTPESRTFELVSSRDRTVLAGTLTLPAGTTPPGAALLLSGSGPQDRDETFYGHKPFRSLAGHLARAGLVVFRWDDRGVGGSGGDYLSASADLLTQDVVDAVGAVRRETAVRRVALVGHSQGTLIATLAAGRRPDLVDALVLLAGMGRPGRELLLDQHRRICLAEGMAPETVDASLAVKDELFQVLVEAEEKTTRGEAASEVLAETESRLRHILSAGEPWDSLSPADHEELTAVVEDLLEWEWRFLLTADPEADLRRVRCPVLAMTGDRDTQASPEDLRRIRTAVRAGGNQAVEAWELAGHNHLFQRCRTGAVSEYAGLKEPWSPESLDKLTKWLLARLASP